MPDIHRGGCLCGAVRFEVRGRFELFFLCHCGRCRKGTGSAHAANLFAGEATLDWVSGADNVTSFAVPGARHARSFCATCGAALPRVASSGRVVVPAGSLETAVPIRPEAHIFCADRADWDHDLDAVPQFDRFPG